MKNLLFILLLAFQGSLSPQIPFTLINAAHADLFSGVERANINTIYIESQESVKISALSSICASSTIRCVDDSPGETQEYTTIQACADVVKAGETCLVYPGNYPEFVQTVSNGAAGSPITFKAEGQATIKGFRIKNQYITVDGFDISKYAVGLSLAHISVEPSGSFCTLKNNKIHDGIYLSSRSYYFDANTKTITNNSGGFIAAGFEVGAKIYIASDINNWIQNHDQVKTIKALTDTTITLSDTDTIVSEGPVFALLYATRTDKSGVAGIHFSHSSSAGAASNCQMIGNTISNLTGVATRIVGNNHLVERNVIERMNGWWIFQFGGSNNIYRFNHVRNSPRHEGFAAPTSDVEHSAGTGSWDFFTAVFFSMGNTAYESINNTFEYNLFENLDNELLMVSSVSPGSTSPALPSRRTVFRNNIFSGIENQGPIHRLETIFENNTFFNSAFASSTAAVIVSGTSAGSADGSVMKSNAFIGNNAINSKDTTGWYSIQNVVMAEPANYNFVAGLPAEGYPPKAGFAGTEPNGVNGGNPAFQNVNSITGPDGIPFTLDDGLKPKPGSPLCGKGPGGTDIGAYSCDPLKVFSNTVVPKAPMNLRLRP